MGRLPDELRERVTPEATGAIRVGDLGEAAHYQARRRHARWLLNAEVSVGRVRGLVLNASAGGLRVALDERLPDGHVDLLVTTEANARRQRACVVWQKELPDGWLCGLRFEAPSVSFQSLEHFAAAA